MYVRACVSGLCVCCLALFGFLLHVIFLFGAVVLFVFVVSPKDRTCGFGGDQICLKAASWAAAPQASCLFSVDFANSFVAIMFQFLFACSRSLQIFFHSFQHV